MRMVTPLAGSTTLQTAINEALTIHHFNGRWWRKYVEDRVRPDFERFGEVVRTRILPVFDDINQEATALEKRRYQELISTVRVPEEDYWDAGEAVANLAFEEASDYHEMLWSMRSATLNLYAAALYHLTEQHIIDLYLMILDREEQRHQVNPDEVIRWFKDRLGLDVKGLPSWPVIHELRLVANAVKHGEGHSAVALHKLRPDLFVLPQFKAAAGIKTRRFRVRKPLFGQDLYVSSEDFTKYHEGSGSFWTEIAAELGKLTR